MLFTSVAIGLSNTLVLHGFTTLNWKPLYMLLIPVEKLSNERDSFRKAREAHIIHKVKTLEPPGIKKHDGL